MCVTRLLKRLNGLQYRLVIGEAGMEALGKLQRPAQLGVAGIAFATLDRDKRSGERLRGLCRLLMCFG